MPGGDQTGPLGAGPRTGRAYGYCAGFGFGRGRGRGRRFGMPHYHSPYGPYPYTGQGEAEILRTEARYLEDSLAEVKERLARLEKQEKSREDKK